MSNGHSMDQGKNRMVGSQSHIHGRTEARKAVISAVAPLSANLAP